VDEVGPDHSEILALLCAQHERQKKADEKLRTDSRAAVKDAVHEALLSVMQQSEYLAGGSPSRVTHGAALACLLLALEDRDRGIANPLLQPAEGRVVGTLRLEVMLERANVVLAAELLYRAGRGREEADKEVAQLLGHKHPVFDGHSGERGRIVKRWREDIDSGNYPEAAEKFDELLAAALATIRARSAEPSADDLVKAASAALGELDRYG
jgi:hypothetical protein